MTSDVYAGDEALSYSTNATTTAGATRFVIIGDAQPDFLARVSAVLLLANELPGSVTMVRQNPDRAMIEVEYTSIGSALAESLFRKISQLTCIDSVCLA